MTDKEARLAQVGGEYLLTYGNRGIDMSRIGNKVIKIPAGVEVMLQENNEVVVKGPKVN